MAENDNGSNVNTTGADKDKQQQQKQAKNQNTNPVQKAQKTKKQMGILKKFVKLISAFPIIGYVLIAILIFLFCWGVIGFFTTLPGTYIESIKEFGEKLWGGLIHYYSEDIVTSSVTEKDQIALAQKLQDMGYDVVGYGFADASYEYDNEENAGDIDGFTNGTITGISTLSDNRNYLQAYIAQSEATYVLANWSVAGALKSGPAGWLDWLFGTNFVDDSEIQEYSEGLINITTLSLNKEKYDPEEFRELQGRMGININVDRENKIMKIISHRTGANTNYYFDLSNWTSLYGKPLELFLSLHLGTMMPDLAYEFATSEAFNTKVNIALQEVQSTFKVIYRKEDGTEITQEDIQRVYLSAICNMSETQINNFANEGKLDDAFEKILSSITDIRDDYFTITDNGTIDLTIQSIAEKYLKEACIDNECTDGGNIVIMNPQNGDILAMATYPDYNLNDPYTLDFIPEDEWDKMSSEEQYLKQQETWNNRAKHGGNPRSCGEGSPHYCISTLFHSYPLATATARTT